MFFYQLSHFVGVNVELIGLNDYINLNIGFAVVLVVRNQVQKDWWNECTLACTWE
jgi:hypothetical protein